MTIKEFNEMMQKLDWRVKDNLIISLNLLNEKKIKEENKKLDDNKTITLYPFHKIYSKALKIKRRENCSILEASVILKNRVKQGVNYGEL